MLYGPKVEYCFYIQIKKINPERSIYSITADVLMNHPPHNTPLSSLIFVVTLLKNFTATVIVSESLLHARHYNGRSADLLRSCLCTAAMIGWSDEIGNGLKQ